ncbi:hypothetical protein [Halodesulfovibrio aestuarii]|uniref:hypothetical protein n=1 Tax=Halodesulfovibrio aestuarii TaxID=126333 RepID=UPI003D343865
MVAYVVHTKMMASGDHEVHVEGCEWCPPGEQLCKVGEFDSSEQAFEAAKKMYPEANGCHLCLPEHYDLS